MRSEVVSSVVAVILLAAVHPLSALISRRHVRRRTISLCAGIALAYVFLHLLPELGRMQQELLEIRGENHPDAWFREHVYVVAFVGLLLFQVVDGIGRKGVSPRWRSFSYRAEIAFFALYAALIGSLITANAELDQPILLVTIALAAHFFGTDLDLAERYEDVFVKRGSFVLAAATVGGMILALVMEVREPVFRAGFSFIAGGLLINTLRTELPEPERVRNLFLLLGAALYAGLILFIYSVMRRGEGGEALHSLHRYRYVISHERSIISVFSSGIFGLPRGKPLPENFPTIHNKGESNGRTETKHSRALG
jgi:zinc transporter ZupT